MSTTVNTTTWMAAAACRDTDPELFFPTAESPAESPAGNPSGSPADEAQRPAYGEQVAAAKAVCAGCPVRAACLAFALEALPYGVAGGHTVSERRELRRNRTGGPR